MDTKTKEAIRNLCRNKTFLDESNIQKVIDVSESLDVMANFNETDMFIDVLSRDKNSAIVVYHARPTDYQSIYMQEVIGEEALRENEPGVLKTIETAVPCKDIKAINQEKRIVKQKIKPIVNEKNEVIGVIIEEKDISSKVEKNFNLGEDSKGLVNLIGTNNINSMLANNLDDGILIFDKSGMLEIKNNNAVNMYKKIGYFYGIDNECYDNLALDKKRFKDIVNDLKNKKKVVKVVSLGDYTYKITLTYIPGNSNLKLMCVIKDITDVKKREKEMRLKDVEIKEAHHRIKNNLQATAAVLRIASRGCKNRSTKNSLDESISRILTIASTHDLLSKSGSVNLGFKEAVREIINNVDSLENKDIEININGDDFQFGGHGSTALLLAINEVVVNCYKHGFKNRDIGKLTLDIKKIEDYITIKILNDGEVFNLNCKEATGLGMGIINMYIVEVLKGTVSIESNNNNTEVTIKFKLKI